MHKVDTDSDGSLLAVDPFRKLFLNSSREQLYGSVDMCDIANIQTNKHHAIRTIQSTT